jgi:hypothetical protein
MEMECHIGGELPQRGGAAIKEEGIEERESKRGRVAKTNIDPHKQPHEHYKISSKPAKT